MKTLIMVISILLLNLSVIPQTYKIVDTGQKDFYNNTSIITEPQEGESFYGQDAHYVGNQPLYTDNGDGTVTDNITGLMWQKSFITLDWEDAESEASSASTGGYNDWRVPTIKELYSLIDFNGNQGTGNPSSSTPPDDALPFINTEYFDFEYGQSSRYIDAQYVTNTSYTSTTMNGNDTFFGVNFADGRIKGYPKSRPDAVPFYARFVRGESNYGENSLVDNGNNTITDEATGLMWSKIDSGNEIFASLLEGYTFNDGSLNWEEALDFAENISFAGYDDWRLPNAKELHSILDYSKSPDASNSAAINDIFETTMIVNEADQDDYPGFWTSTTFNPGTDAVVIFFGRALGYMNFGNGFQFYDVHGAGAQRTDPKIGDPSYGFGPQGDVRRVYNYVRLVRDADSQTSINNERLNSPGSFILEQNYPNPFNPSTSIEYSVPSSEYVNIKVFDILGNEVANLVNERKEAGNYRVNFDASNLTSGLYIYKIKAGSFHQVRKMMLIK
jgi:hypothetical protein